MVELVFNFEFKWLPPGGKDTANRWKGLDLEQRLEES